ncbi:hypothetical protein WJ542_30470 [Paraburkholderia sp. B3]|uniref:hypothetical protein n=1 Tax=Paraburkholderia sp. B3 TaxID=3134791 RepID=UPI00398204BC
MVIVENGAQGCEVTGTGDTIIDTGASGSSLLVSGSGNTVFAGTGVQLSDYADGDTITVGANNSDVWLTGANDIVYATRGDDSIFLQGSTGTRVNADNDLIDIVGFSGVGTTTATVSGNNNEIIEDHVMNAQSGPVSLALQGSGNSVEYMNNGVFNVGTDQDASKTDLLSLQGDSNVIVLNNNTSLDVSGNENSVNASSDTQGELWGESNYWNSSIGNTVYDHGDSSYIAVAEGSTVYAYGTNGTIVADSSADYISLDGAGYTINAVNDTIDATSGNSFALTGSGNSINMNYDLSARYGQAVQIGSASLTVESGEIVLNSSMAGAGAEQFVNGVLTLQLGNGNIATISDVTSGTVFNFNGSSATLQNSGVGSSLGASVSDTQTAQLVAAMATYSSGAASVSSPTMTQTATQPSLFASAHQ